ncbi:hypothetical protein ES708_23476 [subsurface metagenome]
MYYSWAQDSTLIRSLPAFYPCQLVFSSAFTNRFNAIAALRGLAYAGGLTGILSLIVHLRLRRVWRRPGMADPPPNRKSGETH